MFALIAFLALANLAAQRAPLTPVALADCLGTRRYALNFEQLAAARAITPDEIWNDACRQARDANARRLTVVRTLLVTGRAPVGGYPSTSHLLQMARESRDPVHTALYQHAANDQVMRESLGRPAKAAYAGGLSPLALKLLDGLISRDAVEADAANRRWLGPTVAGRGWFSVSRDGEEADRAGWFLVQHADVDRDFQHAMILKIEPLALAGDSSLNRFSYLYDRWAAGAEQPQRYGGQGRCVGPGHWEPLPIESPETLDRRRAAAGLKPMAEVRAEASRACR